MALTMKQTLASFLLYYFRVLAKIQLLKNRPLVIGITGSAGKTTVMHAVEAVLQDHYQLKVSTKANSQSGLSLNILGLNPTSFSAFDWLRLVLLAPLKLLTNWEKYQVYVAEMGIDGPDEPANMEYLLKIVTPTIGVFTSVTLVHAQAFDHLVTERDVKKRELALKTAIAGEKAKLITRLPANGSGIYNADDPVIAAACAATHAQHIAFGTTNKAVVRLVTTRWPSDGGTQFVLKHNGQEAVIALKQYLLPEHYGLSFAAAAAVGAALGYTVVQSAEALQHHFILPPGRATLIPAINGATILDSSYNSAPAPLLDFFDLLATLKQRKTAAVVSSGRLVGLLGDMRELGKLSGYEHTRIAKRAGEVLDAVYLVGPEMREHAFPVLKKANVPVFWFVSATAAAQQLKKDLRPDDLLLVKGSQNTILLEIAIEQLMAHPENAEALLCRRGTFWNDQRMTLGSTTLKDTNNHQG